MGELNFQNVFDKVRKDSVMVHCITNYVTINDVANIILAMGASPIMADDPIEVCEITGISDCLVINMGTLKQNIVRSMLLAGKKGFCSINIEKSMMNSEIGFGRKVLQVFEDQGISFEHVPSGIDTMTVYVHQDEFEEKEQQVIAGIHRLVQPDFVEMESDLALIAVVGRGMKSTRGTAGRIFSALAHANVNVKMIDQGSSELNIIIGVENRDFENAVKAIYDIFVLTQI